MSGRLQGRWLIAGGALCAVVLTAACVQLAPQAWSRLSGIGRDELDAATILALEARAAAEVGQSATGRFVATVSPGAAASSARAGGGPQVTVRRGPIAETVAVQGRIAGQEEVAVSFAGRGVVQSVLVKPGDEVQAGQVLLEADSRDLARELMAARARLDASAIRVTQVQVQAQSVRRENDRRLQAERAQRQAVVSEAEAGARRALADLQRVRAGTPRADREAAAGVAIQARGALERAEADLARLQAGPNAAELRAGDSQVTVAQVALQRAEADVARLVRGPDQADLRVAERDLAGAQSAAERAQADVDRLTRSGDSYEVRFSQREVERAQNTLRAAEATTATDAAAQAIRDAAVTNARLDVQQATDRLAQAHAPPPPAEVEAARRALAVAQREVEAARERLEVVRRGPDRLSLEAAQAAVESARIALETATARQRELQAGPPADQIAAATNTVAAARTALASAAARVAELDGRPTPAELREAEDRVTVAQTALARARAEAQLTQPAGDSGAYDLALLENGLEQERAQVASLERELEATQLRAPIDGTVVAVHVRSGDPLESGRPLVVLAPPGQPVVRADLTEREVARLATGQMASVQMAGGTPADGMVTAILPGEGGTSRTALIAVEWPVSPPAIGALAQVAVIVQQKENALIVPRQAVRSAGVRHYVQYLEGVTRRVANVEVGIVTSDAVEIVSGLVEGQQVLSGT